MIRRPHVTHDRITVSIPWNTQTCEWKLYYQPDIKQRPIETDYSVSKSDEEIDSFLKLIGVAQTSIPEFRMKLRRELISHRGF